MRGITNGRMGSIAALGILTALLVFSSGCNFVDKLKARDRLNKGVNSFRTAQYTAAADSFKEAIALDPELPSARLYLATAYMTQWVPGSDAPDNKRNADSALKEFQTALDSNLPAAQKLVAMQSLASLHYQMKDFPGAIDWNKKVIAADPQNKSAYYTLGVIAWTEFVTPWREALAAQNLKPEDPGPLHPPKGKKDADLKADLKAKYYGPLSEGIDDEKKALEIDPEYENAMAYMNLLIRYRSILDDTKEQYDADIKTADGWVQKSLETTKVKAKRKADAAAAGAQVTP